MIYQHLLAKLYSINLQKGIKLGLENPLRLSKGIGNPHTHYPCIHIAGTNGKGSVTAKIAKGLESRYSRVGLFTSPHISSFRERIQINGELISEDDVVKHLQTIFALADNASIPVTFFECVTVLAFAYFAQKHVDIAVIETGLGGRLDATNIISPLLTVITSISLDHTDFLGNTLEAIAKEKAGIIKPGIPLILGPSSWPVPVPEGTVCIKVPEVHGSYEEENRAIARCALEQLQISEKAIKKALTTRLPCRGEIVDDGTVILDGGHNPDALSKLFAWINLPPHQLTVICGFSKSKDLFSCLDIIRRHANHIHLAKAANERCVEPEKLYQILLTQGVPSSCITVHPSIKDSIRQAKHSLAQQTALQKILICGSFYIMSEARQALQIEEPCDPIDLR